MSFEKYDVVGRVALSASYRQSEYGQHDTSRLLVDLQTLQALMG